MVSTVLPIYVSYTKPLRSNGHHQRNNARTSCRNAFSREFASQSPTGRTISLEFARSIRCVFTATYSQLCRDYAR